MKFLRTAALIFLGSMVIMSCQKGDDDNPQPSTPGSNGGGGNGSGISTPPQSFTKKVMLEYHTASWCGTCVDAHVKRDELMTNYPDRIFPVVIHQSDGMQKPIFFTIDSVFGSNPTYGMVNRTPSLNNILLNRTQWLSNATISLGQSAACGLAMNSSYSGNTAQLEVQAAFNQNLTGQHNLTVYVLEKTITGSGTLYDQMNSFNNDPSSPYFNKGNPIVGFEHRFVLNRAVTLDLGDQIPSNLLVRGGVYIANFNVDLTGLVPSNVKFVAFVNKPGNSATTHSVLNVQSADLGNLKDWD